METNRKQKQDTRLDYISKMSYVTNHAMRLFFLQMRLLILLKHFTIVLCI